ncbi:serine/threonine protein kinase, partial [Gemmatimonadota bacterium]
MRYNPVIMKDQQVGHYKILRKLGAGGMGEVWLAEDTRLERKVAIKFLPHHAAQEEAEKARFVQEAKAAARLTHNNIAQVYEIGEEEDRLYIVMEYVSGGSLRDQLDEAKGRSLPLEKVLTWVQEAAQGLAEAHKQGIIHRDIKPDNLMLTESGQVKITDFGLARLETATRLTMEGATLGTVNYVAPEQITGREVDHRADLFSLGATFYELLTGHRAFEGADANATYFAIINEDIESLSRFRKSLPDGLEILVNKLLEKNPALRCQTAAETVSDILRLQRVPIQQPIVGISKEKIASRLRTIHTSTWLAWALLILAITIQSIPLIANFRQMSRELTFGELLAATEGEGSGPLLLSGYGTPYRSVIPIPFEKFVVTKSKIIERLDDLKSTRDIDSFIAAALILGGEDGEKEIEEAMGIALTDATLFGLRASFRYHAFGPRDSLAATCANTAMQLDSDNGAYAVLAAVGAAARGDTTYAEELLQAAVYAPNFSLNWSRHYGAVYRSLMALGLLRPNWQLVVDPPLSVYRPITDLIKAYMFGYRYTADWDLWKDSWQGERDERAEEHMIAEILGMRIQSDDSASLFGWMFGLIITSFGLQSDPPWTVFPDDTLELARNKYRAHINSITRDLVIPERQNDPLYAALYLGAWTYSFYLWSWIILIISM